MNRKLLLALLPVAAGGWLVANLRQRTLPKATEDVRVPNPSGFMDAVVVTETTDEGATGGTTFFKVLVVPRGRPAIEGENNLILEVTDAEGFGKDGSWRPQWNASDRLTLRLRQGRVWRFTNYVWDSAFHCLGVRLLVDGYGWN